MAEAFTTLTSTAMPLRIENVDTDQVIPARFLKVTTKAGLGKHLFNDWRYLPGTDNTPAPDFVLNDAQYAGSQILVAGDNFGCGSSREHAPWALVDFGFRAIIAPSFADIFKNNAMKNGLLPVVVPQAVIEKLWTRIEAEPMLKITIDLEAQTVMIPGEESISFDIDPFRKTCMLEGLDDIGYTLKHEADIARYEAALAN